MLTVAKLLAIAAVVCLGWFALNVQPASSHPLPKGTGVKIGLHRICTSLGVCKDRPPRPSSIAIPLDPCTKDNEGEVKTIYDPKLGADVDWQCRCINEVNCQWFRVGIHQATLWPFWGRQQRGYVLDWMRRCPSIVCKGKLTKHYYHVYYGGTL